MWTIVSATLPRLLAFALGGFALFNVVGDWVRPGFDANIWWIDLRAVSPQVARPFLVAASSLLVWHALSPAARATWRAALTLGTLGVLAAFVVGDCVRFYGLLNRGEISAGFPVPFSLAVLATLFWIGWGVARTRRPVAGSNSRRALVCAGVLVALAAGFPLGQMCCFGKTDYRRPADAIVVFGAGVYPNGHPSRALRDRVRTACALYHQGLARKLIFSGGPGMGAVHETEAMRRFATTLEEHAVPDDAILVDTDGLDTRATVENTSRLCRRHGFRRVLAVSHFYHLPRIKLTFERAGQDVYTVPATESRTLPRLPFYLAREVAALWLYYLRPPTDAA